MRGVVTLAAAFAIPEEVPGREVLLLIALFVTGGTLLIHGLTLPWLVRRLKVSPPDPREDALARAELLQAASRAGLDRLEEVEDDDDLHEGVRQVLHSRIEQREFAAWERLGAEQSEGETPERALRAVARRHAGRRARPGPGAAQHRPDPARGRRGRAVLPRHRGVHDRLRGTTPP